MATTDILGGLLEAKWRDVAFPTVAFRMPIMQDQAEHLWPDRDGGHVESTGRRPVQYEFTIPFRNGLVPSKGETWKRGTLYPTVWRAFLAACLDKSTGTLVHPELGPIQCKLRHAVTDWNARARDGVDMHVVWVESNDDENALDNIVAGASPLGAAVAAANDVDDLLATMNPPYVYPKWKPTLSDLMHSIQAAIDTPGMLAAQVGGAIDQVGGSIQRISDSIDRLNTTALWPITQAIGRLKSSVHELRTNTNLVSRQSKSMLVYVTPSAMTLATVATKVHAPIADIIALNPTLVGEVLVPKNTPVAYYATSASLSAALGGGA